MFDVQRIEGIDAHRVLYDIHREVEQCTGHKRNFWKVKAYTAAAIFSLQSNGKLQRVAGLAKDHRLYIVRGLNREEARGTMLHEFGHYVTRMPHKEIDPLLKACGIPLSMRVPR